jgi:DNA recombination protein RmuC
MLNEVIFFAAGLLLGAAVIWLRYRGINKSAENSLSELAARYAELKNELEQRREELTGIIKNLASFEAENRFLKTRLETQKKEYEDFTARFTNQFKVIAGEIFEEKSRKLTEANQSNIERLLAPLDKNIEEFKKKVEDTYDKESKQRFSLEEKIKELVELNNRISEEANNLTRALKGDPKKQGDWGEMILENILERSGLARGREYIVQGYLTDEGGNPLKNDSGEKMRPDVIVNFPDGRKIIIDSKVSLVSYERFSSAESTQEKERFLGELVKSVRAHIDGLSGKNYQDFAETLEFVMLFIPIEPAYFAAMSRDPELLNYAYSKRILLMSPTNLIAALKLVLDLWKRDNQSRNAVEIAERGGQLYDKFVTLLETLRGLGDSIEKTKRHYDQAVGQLKEGKGNLLGQVEKLKELGVKAKKSLPENETP